MSRDEARRGWGPGSPLEPRYRYRGASGPSLRALTRGAHLRWDRIGVRTAFGEGAALPTADRDQTSPGAPGDKPRPAAYDRRRSLSGAAQAGHATCIAGARRLPSSYIPGRRRPGGAPLRELLQGACERLLAGRVALALSGGVDSAVLLALLRGRAPVYTLVPAHPGYSEEAETLTIASRLGAIPKIVRVGEADYVAALPEAIAGCETPLYNLHPVSRYLLSRAAAADGFKVLISGDGADEIFRDTAGTDYLPIVGALTRAAGLRLVSPYLDPAVAPLVAFDPGKRALRRLALELGVPAEIANRPKHSRLAPPMDLSRHADAPLLFALGRALNRTPALADDRGRVCWTTLALFCRVFPELLPGRPFDVRSRRPGPF